MSDLTRLLDRQAGLVARRQLSEHGVHWDDVRTHLRAHRCVVRSPRVVSTFTGELTVVQRRWLGVLHAGPRSMVGGLTAAEHLGLRRWGRDDVTVLVDDELAFEPVEGIDFFRSRRSFELLARPASDGLPTCRLEPAVLMWAGYDATPRAAHAILAAAVQQRLTTPAQLLRWVDLLRPLRRAPAFRATLRDIAGGAQSGAELDVARMCRRFGIRPPDRQRPRLDRAGRRRFTDCEWELADGSTLVLEVDGSFHMEVEHWGADKKRSRRLTTRHRTVVGCTAYEVRHEPEEVARDLLSLGVPAACA
ncbi:hypothetical protein [Nocardioides sp. GXQ0305]|uniref:hypothetical protein n=1 Tax=Nocardioides sp. GXQ0305 TaxID=3423912 RepID=UPI003D7D207F